MLEFIPSLNTNEPLRILCLGAHSDDIEIGCGGMLLELASGPLPVEIRWVVFSGKDERVEEALRSAEWWLDGVKDRQIEIHDYPDGNFPGDWSAIKRRFEAIKQSFSPDLVLTHYNKDLHQDHRIVSELTWNTFRNHAVLEYEIPKYDGDLGRPNLFVPISRKSAEDKAAALVRFYGSQRQKHWFDEQLFLGLMRIRGMEARAPSGFAEAFHARKICAGFNK